MKRLKLEPMIELVAKYNGGLDRLIKNGQPVMKGKSDLVVADLCRLRDIGRYIIYATWFDKDGVRGLTLVEGFRASYEQFARKQFPKKVEAMRERLKEETTKVREERQVREDEQNTRIAKAEADHKRGLLWAKGNNIPKKAKTTNSKKVKVKNG